MKNESLDSALRITLSYIYYNYISIRICLGNDGMIFNVKQIHKKKLSISKDGEIYPNNVNPKYLPVTCNGLSRSLRW